MKKIGKIIGVILIFLVILYSIFYFGGSFGETYRLNKLAVDYQNNPDSNLSKYSMELMIVAMMRMATNRYTESQPLWDKYLKTNIDYVNKNEMDRDKFKRNMLVLRDIYPSLMYFKDSKIADKYFYEGLSILDRMHDGYYLNNLLDKKESELLACTYAHYLPYAVKSKDVNVINSILDKIDSVLGKKDVNCITISKNELIDAKIISRVFDGNFKEAMNLYKYNYNRDVDRVFLEDFAKNYIFQLLKSDNPKIGRTQPEMLSELERGIHSDLYKHIMFKYVYIPMGQWGYFIGGLE